jgi:hypothetical protein
VNPTLETLVLSLQQSIETLKRAPPNWWKEGGDIPAPFEDESVVGDEDDDGDGDDDEEEPVDLMQPSEPPANHDIDELSYFSGADDEEE